MNITTNGPLYPPLPPCWNTNEPCPATMDMLNFLNISSQASYLQYYCLNPPKDSCEFLQYCPNPDVAGLYVRVATYVTNVCLALVILHSPSDVRTTFYAQILSVYSLFITTCISIANQSLTRFHGTYALITIGSPLSIALVIYALLSLSRQDTRMKEVFEKGKERWLINRLLVLFMVPCWIAIMIFLPVVAKRGSLSQVACDKTEYAQVLLIFMFVTPILPFAFSVKAGLIGLTPLLVLLVVWVICIILRRKWIWSGNSKLPVWRMWRAVCDNYPFVHFATVVVFPFSYWIATLELGAALQMEDGVNSQATFGQILAVTVAIPPFLSFLTLLPRLPGWFWNLTWVRALTCRLGESERTTRSSSVNSLGKDPESLNQQGVGLPIHSPHEEPQLELGPVETKEYAPLTITGVVNGTTQLSGA
ncbi:hypothetical protein JAAARDRAFT_209399 [Jaapia argillacea MUCL 33604]|uniref:Uncharacterized protein n=1 Tax=Jaapia argillacea MUCL 33604 TaxID=933084 RepID=A0A067PHH1_9AGAM|nr:hypothetical protein JAAARDRAFT_209399 [Jaapia argillacea MUCL 33604]